MYLKKKLHKTHKEIEDCDVTGQLDRKLNKLGKGRTDRLLSGLSPA